MASFEACPSGWRAHVRRKGFPSTSRTFDLRSDAEAWAQEVEREFRRGNLHVTEQKVTFKVIAERYAASALPALKSQKTSLLFLRKAQKRFGQYFVTSIRAVDVANWRDELLSAGTSARSTGYCLAVLSAALSYATSELSVQLPAGNPVHGVRKPRLPAGRDRRLRPGELDALLATADTSRSPGLKEVIELAVATSMRLGELLGMEWKHIDLAAGTAHLPSTKNGTSRTVALSSVAIAALQRIQGKQRKSANKVFPNWSSKYSLEKAWARCRRSARIAYESSCTNDGTEPDQLFLADLRFHDLRHEATSRLFELGLGMMEVASMTGHKSTAMLMRYTHIEASQLAKKLG